MVTTLIGYRVRRPIKREVCGVAAHKHLLMITAVPSANRQTDHRSHSLAHFPPRIDRDSGLIYQDHSQSGAGGYPHPSGGAVHRFCAVHAPTPCASAACACASTACAHCICAVPARTPCAPTACASTACASTAPAPCLRPRAVQPARPACTARSTPRTTSPLHWTKGARGRGRNATALQPWLSTSRFQTPLELQSA